MHPWKDVKHVCAHSHHEEHGGDDQAGVGCVAEKRPHEGRQIQVDGFHDHVKHLLLPTARSHTEPQISRFTDTEGVYTNGAMVQPEGAAVKGGGQGHDGVDHRQQTQEEHQEQETHVEVVGLGGLKDSLVGDISGHHRPALVVHGAEEAQHVDAHQTRGVKRSHPETEPSQRFHPQGSA